MQAKFNKSPAKNNVVIMTKIVQKRCFTFGTVLYYNKLYAEKFRNLCTIIRSRHYEPHVRHSFHGCSGPHYPSG